jgi:hypothetical protein
MLHAVDLSFQDLIKLPSALQYNHLKVIDLKGNLLREFPYHLLQVDSLEELILSRNLISSFDPIECSKLVYLDLSYNVLTELNPNCFNYLKNLLSLNLSGNQLSFLPNVEALTNIQTFCCSANQIKELPAKWPLGTLKSLDLSCNLLETLPDGFFESMTSLSCLSLDSNPISALPNLQDLMSLETLNLTDTLIDLDSLPLSIVKLSQLRLVIFSTYRQFTATQVFAHVKEKLQQIEERQPPRLALTLSVFQKHLITRNGNIESILAMKPKSIPVGIDIICNLLLQQPDINQVPKMVEHILHVFDSNLDTKDLSLEEISSTFSKVVYFVSFFSSTILADALILPLDSSLKYLAQTCHFRIIAKFKTALEGDAYVCFISKDDTLFKTYLKSIENLLAELDSHQYMQRLEAYYFQIIVSIVESSLVEKILSLKNSSNCSDTLTARARQFDDYFSLFQGSRLLRVESLIKIRAALCAGDISRAIKSSQHSPLDIKEIQKWLNKCTESLNIDPKLLSSISGKPSPYLHSCKFDISILK